MYLSILSLCLFLSACNGGVVTNNPTDSPTSGKIHISVDETFKPVIEKQLEMYHATWPNTEIIAHYKPEADCMKDFFSDSLTSMVLVTRMLNDKEQSFFKSNNNVGARMELVAYDAVAVVVNKNNPDTLLTMNYLRDLLTGKLKNGKVAVFDGFNATSTVRFAIDSIMKGANFDTTVVRAVKNSQEVLNYVSSNTNAIGFVGFSWIGNPEKPEQVEMLKKVKLASFPCSNCDSTVYIKPSQYNISTKDYPLVRGLHYIIKDTYMGLGYGFATFLRYERGQLIFRRSYLGVTMSLAVREVILDSTLKKQ